MKGTHRVVVETPRVRYELEIKHKFSIILGDSGSGKSLLCSLLAKGCSKQPGMSFRSDLKAIALNRLDVLENDLSNGYNLFFVDEDVVVDICRGDSGEYFGRLVKGTSAYFVFMSRNESLSAVPLNVDACYSLVHQRRGGKNVLIMDRLYNWKNDVPLKPDLVIVEDSKVGFAFYNETLGNICESARGNSNVIETVKSKIKHGEKNIFVIADGCGFGTYFYTLLRLKKFSFSADGVELRLFLPPSFEYIILCSNIFKVNPDILNNTQNYAKIEKYMGWEAFYTDYLVHVSKGAYRKNGKKLPKFLKDSRNIRKIYDFIHEIEGV